MSKFIASAALVSGLTLIAHFFGGGPEYHTTAWLSDMSIDQKTIYSLLWHAITALLLVNTVALVIAARGVYQRPLVLLVVAQYLAIGGLFIFFGLQNLGTIWQQPQWIAFTLISALAMFGLFRTNAQ